MEDVVMETTSQLNSVINKNKKLHFENEDKQIKKTTKFDYADKRGLVVVETSSQHSMNRWIIPRRHSEEDKWACPQLRAPITEAAW